MVITSLALSGKNIIPREEVDVERQSCLDKGGKWNAKTRTCTLPEPETTEKKVALGGTGPKIETPRGFQARVERERNQAQDPRGVEVIRDQDTGELTGITKGGKTFLGLPPAEVRAQAEIQAKKQELVIGGAAEASQARAIERLKSQGLDLSAQVGQPPLEALDEQLSAQNVDYLAAVFSASPGLVPDLITGGLTGYGLAKAPAIAAAATTGGTAAPVSLAALTASTVGFAVMNGVRGFYSDFISDIKRQKGELIETPIRTLTETKTQLDAVTSAQNSNPSEATINLESFNQMLQVLDEEFDRLKDLTDDDLNKFLGEDGINQIQEYEVYFYKGERDRQIEDFQLALSNPDPARINPSGSQIEKIKARIDEELAKLRDQR